LRNVRFSDFSPSSALDVVETKKAINQIVLTLKAISTDFSSKLFITIVCCSKAVIGQIVLALKCIKTSVSSNRRRRKEKGYRLDCFGAKGYQNCSFERIIYHDCLLLTTRRYIYELCIDTSLS